MTFRRREAAGLIAIAVASMLMAGPGQASAQGSLYARMGGKKVVAAFVGQTIDRVVADPRLNQSFRDVNTVRVKRELAAYICHVAGGGCLYTGVPIREVHANLGITQAQFFGLVRIMRRQMRLNHVGLRERNQLLALLAPLEPEVVDVRVAPAPRTN